MRLVIALVVLAAAASHAEDWPQWRGPERTGVTAEPSGHPDGWPPRRLWTAETGRGAASPILADGKVFVMGWQGPGKGAGTDAVICLEASTGKELWRQTYRSRYQARTAAGDRDQYGGPNSTPAYDAQTGFLFTLGIDGDLRCWDVARGGRGVWAKNLYDEFRVPQRPAAGAGDTGVRDYGFSSAPLLWRDQVIVDVGGAAGLVVGFDRKTGAVRWRSESTELAGSNSGPAFLRVGGIECVASLGLKALVVTRLDRGHEGKTLARVPWETSFACNIATPGVLADRVVLTSAYSMSRSAMFTIAPGGARPAWSVGDHAMVSSPVLHDGNVFLPEGALRCLDAGSGRLKWKSVSLGKGSCIVTGDRKVLAHGRGRLVLVDESSGRELAALGGVASGYPSIAFGNGIIACKDDAGKVEAFSVRPAAAP